MIKTTMKTEEVKVYEKFCDVCGKPIPRGMACSVAKCEYCGKDLCKNCIGHETQETGDNKTVYCERCWTIGADYRTKVTELETQIDLLYDEWISVCASK